MSTSWSRSTQFDEAYMCCETDDRIEDRDGLMFVCPAKEGRDADCAQLCSIGKNVLKKIPKALRSNKEFSANAAERLNIYTGTAKFEYAGRDCDFNRHFLGGSERDVGEFLFSITQKTARQYIPNSLRFLKSRARKDIKPWNT